MLDERVQALEDRTGRIESKLDTVAVKLDLMAEQQAEMRADMKAMAKDLKSVEISQADMCGQLRQMPSTWTMMTTFLAVSLALVTMIVGGIALLPALQAWMAPS